ncbi:hypothetical protein BDN72DRAFT_865805 [Pluteus cervinus]|uniref:Uncharacterized protein n=1 Tax=Pluteus cervinus TaxID=181527 RepID=A0ACD2ZYG1_9AGAR|nr:hypothetical protein BDN72DRAFT_865805 [Pluteus cervinus]
MTRERNNLISVRPSKVVEGDLQDREWGNVVCSKGRKIDVVRWGKGENRREDSGLGHSGEGRTAVERPNDENAGDLDFYLIEPGVDDGGRVQKRRERSKERTRESGLEGIRGSRRRRTREKTSLYFLVPVRNNNEKQKPPPRGRGRKEISQRHKPTHNGDSCLLSVEARPLSKTDLVGYISVNWLGSGGVNEGFERYPVERRAPYFQCSWDQVAI